MSDLTRRHIIVTAQAWYDDVTGGAFRVASDLAEHLAYEGHRVTYVCSGNTAHSVIPQLVRGVDVRRYPAPTGSLAPLRLRQHIRATRRAVGEVLRESPVDAVNAHGPLQFLGAARALRAARSGAFLTYSAHSPFDDEVLTNADGRPSMRRRLAARWAFRADRTILRSANSVHALSQYTFATLLHKHGHVARKIAIAPGWVDVARFAAVPDRTAARRLLGGPWLGDTPLFFTLRRMEPRMGLDTLLRAARRLADDGHRFRVLIGGDGSLRGQLNQMLTDLRLDDRVALLGRLAEERLPACYAATDCFILPTRALECFGLIVLEAFAAGTPVIASNVGAIPELVGQQCERWLFQPDDDAGLANRMRLFLRGELRSADVRSIALRYDRAALLPAWSRLVLAGARG